ncbi:hypothetical protein ABD86_14220 [Paenibacillus alvei]|nr:hypothetical protein [Paenibacillus alvei]MBG9745052.1 hypothetical protein [Paenibacillus alvei]
MHSLIYELLWNGHTMLSAIVLMHIHLIHPVFLAVYRKFPWHKGSPPLYPLFIGGGYLFALGMSWIFVYGAFRYIPDASFGLGASPRYLMNRKKPVATIDVARHSNAS